MLLKNNEIYKKMEKIELLKKKNLFDIYFNDVFINLHADINKKVFYFFFDENENFLFMPILVSPIFQRKNDNFYFETVYGYSGPLSTSYQLSFLNKAWKTFFDDCQKAGIISGLIRFNPFLENHLTVQNQSFIDLVREKKIVYSTMLNDYMHYFDKFSVNVKKNLKNSNNLDFVISEKINSKNIEEFKKIYFKLMNKKKADDNYYFDDNYFDNLLFKLPNNTGMISVIHKNKLIGAIIYLRFDTKIHIHLSAVDVEFRNKGISYVLRSHIFKLFQKTNYILNFGGGLQNSESDSLFKFKYGFSDKTKDYYIGKVITDMKKHNHFKKMTYNKYGDQYINMHMPYSFYKSY